jgi:dolichol-phosphate mannosyltransferase
MLSIVIPVYNEEESLAALHGELSEVARARDYDLQILFIDDGSRDGSWRKIQELAAADPRVEGVRFRRNFGKAAALSAGFRAARGELVVTMDADLQDDPAEIPRFLAQLDEGYDVVSGWKKVRHDPWHKVYPSRVFNGMVSWLNGVKLHDHNCGMKCYRREVLDEVYINGELHRFIPVLAAARGFRVGEIVIRHRARKFGQSKYGVERIIKGFLDLLTVKFLTNFWHRPLHVLGSIGLTSFLLGVFVLIYLAIRWIVSRVAPGMEPIHLHQGAAIYYALGLLIIGAQFLSTGILGELLTSYVARDVDVYSISETTSSVEREPLSKANAP